MFAITVILASILVNGLFSFFVIAPLIPRPNYDIENIYKTFMNIYEPAELSFTVGSIHSKITIYKDNQTIFDEYHAGTVTKLGTNMTLAKLTGNSTMFNMTQYSLNLTYVGIGNQGVLTTDSTILPGEWARVLAMAHDGTYNSVNFTVIIHPGAGGPYTADCLGIYFESAGNNLWGYDTFTEVTGIDSTFTIVMEIKLTLT